MRTPASLLPAAVAALRSVGVPGPVRDVRLLMAHALAVPADRLSLHLGEPMSDDAAARFEALIARRAARQPVSQIIGRRLFWGRSFVVTPDVLDPRPETETLIAAALTVDFTRVLDLGTGSGALMLTLLAERPAATGLGVDLSPAALTVARANAAALGLGARVQWQESDWFSAVTGQFDLIVVNPPYIAAAEMPTLDPEVRDWEPHLALTPGGDGLDAYRSIASGICAYLQPGGTLLAEIGPGQGAAVAALFRRAGLTTVNVLSDLDGRDRVTSARAGDDNC